MVAGGFENSSEVWVFIELGDKAPERVSLELLGKGRLLADKLGACLSAVVAGEGIGSVGEELIHYGADRVLAADHPLAKDYRTEFYTHVIAREASKTRPEVLMVGATPTGRDLAPRLAARLKTGCIADCTELDIDTERRLLIATKPFYGRNLMADFICPHHRPQIVTVRPGVMEAGTRNKERKGEVIPLDVELVEKDILVKVMDTVESGHNVRSLEEAAKVVVVGMGTGSIEVFEMIKELSELLGAELGATSLPVDAGWISKERMIGQTGKTISPRLYLGCGVSGAIQHSVGMMNSELIVAINTDPKAEIFELADYGIIGDVARIVPAIVKRLRAINA